MAEDEIFFDKIFFNNLLSRFDTLHDFCDKNADRVQDRSLDKGQQSIEFANVFKKEILNAMEKEINITDISEAKLSKDFNIIIDKYITDKSQVSFYKEDFKNLIDRRKNGLTLCSILKPSEVTGKLLKLSAFEPSIVSLYEFLFNIVFPKEKSIGKFISNINLPIYDFVEKLYKYGDIQSDRSIKYTINHINDIDINHINNYISECVKNEESIITFFLGKIKQEDDGDYDVTGFFKFNVFATNKESIIIDNNINIADRYFIYLSNFRIILGKYFLKDENVMFNLIVDTTNISFSKYYKELTPTQRKTLKIRVLCNVAMNWDGANSGECQTRVQMEPSVNKLGELNIIDKKDNKTTRSIFDLKYLELDEQNKTTLYKFYNSTVPYNIITPIPREVGKISECIRQQISKTTKNRRNITSECAPFANKGQLFDLKRTGDALQVLMTQKLNKENEALNKENEAGKEFHVFVTIDHLAFLKARINGIPSIYTSRQRDAKNIENKVMVLYNSKSSKNYKVTASQLLTEIILFDKIASKLENYNIFPIKLIGSPNEFDKDALWRFYLMIDYMCRIMFGVVVFIRPNDNELIEKTGNFGETEESQSIMQYLKALLSEHFSLSDIFKDKLKFLYYNPFVEKCFLAELNRDVVEVLSLIETLNAKISLAKENLQNHPNISSFEIPLLHGRINKDKIKENLDKFIVNSFIIECFYTIKRSGIFKQYLYDMKKIDTKGMRETIPILNNAPSDSSNNETSPNINVLENASDNLLSEAFSKALNYLETLTILNKKYQCFTGDIQNNDNIDLLNNFFEDYKDDNNSFKENLNELFGFKFNEYKTMIERLKIEIQTTFDKDIYPKIDNWLNKFAKTDFFVEPARRSRNSLSVQDKINECVDFFNPITYDKNVQEFFYTKVHNICETFYKNKIAELHVINISSKPIPFEKVVHKIIKDTIIVPRDGGKKNKTNDIGLKKEKQQVGGILEIDQEAIKNIITLLDCDLLYDEETYAKLEGWNDICLSRLNNLDGYRSIYKRYKYFIIDIYNSDKGHIPTVMDISNDTYIDWGLPSNYIEEFSYKEGELQKNDITIPMSWEFSDNIYKDGELQKNDITVPMSLNIYKMISSDIIKDVVNKFSMPDYRLFVFNLFSEILKQVIDKFYAAIHEYYTSISSEIYSIKGNNSIYDTIIWMMINDPSMLLYHPSRNNTWDIIEQKIIYSMNNNILLKGGEAFLKRKAIIDDVIEKSNNQEELNETDTKKQRIEYIEDLTFMTTDEYIYMKCIFDSKFLLKTNLGILASIDTGDITDGEFKFRDINLYNPSVMESGNILSYGKDENLSLSGGSKNIIINKFATLADYHKKYYKQYYNLYYT